MTSATPTTLGATGMRRNRIVLLALLPLIALALGACVFWAYLILVVSGMFFLIGFPVGFALGLILIWATFVGLASLGSLLWDGASARRWRRAALVAPLGFAYIGLWPFLRDYIARGEAGAYLCDNVDWAIAALWAQAAYPLVAGLMATLILLPERASSRVAVWRGLLAIGLVWAFLLSALGPAVGWARADLRSRSISLRDEIPTDNRNPIVVAVCAGRLANAAELIRAQGHQLGEGDVANLLRNCMRTATHIPRSYAERVGLVLDATLAWEARGAPQATQGCTAYQKSLLREVYKSDFPYAAIQTFVARGLPITCPLEPGESEPIWWSAFYRAYHGDALDAQRLPRLQALGIDLRQTDSKGLDLVAANPNGFISSSSDADLLSLAELGLHDQPGARTPHTLVIEVMHRLGAGDAVSPDLLRAYQRVGAPTDEQLREVMERAPWMLSGKPWMLEGGSRRLETYSDIQRDRERRLQDVIERQRVMERQLRYGAF